MKSLSVCGLILLSFVIGLFAGRNPLGSRREPNAARQLPADAAPTEIRLSVPPEANGAQRTVKKLRVRSSDAENPENLWVVYLTVGGTTYGHVCEADPDRE